MQKLLLTIDAISTFIGKAAAWAVVGLTVLISWEVFSRYALNNPHAWVLDAQIMLYGTLFMLAGGYTLSKNGHVRGDVLYGFFSPRAQASVDLLLYIVFFLPGIAALAYAGWDYAALSWRINEHSNVTADGPPVYHFKAMIPLAGMLLLLQGSAEIARCVICLKTGVWPSRLKDVSEIDVVEEQLALSEHVDDETRKNAIEHAQSIEESARQRGLGGDLQR